MLWIFATIPCVPLETRITYSCCSVFVFTFHFYHHRYNCTNDILNRTTKSSSYQLDPTDVRATYPCDYAREWYTTIVLLLSITTMLVNIYIVIIQSVESCLVNYYIFDCRIARTEHRPWRSHGAHCWCTISI